MGRTDALAYDPSVADYRATSPASPGRKAEVLLLGFPPCAQRGEVAPAYGDGGVMGRTDALAYDPSALVRRGHLPFADSAKGRKV